MERMRNQQGVVGLIALGLIVLGLIVLAATYVYKVRTGQSLPLIHLGWGPH